MADKDPVAEALGDTEDLYDIAEWEPRSVFDRGSVLVYRAIRASWRYFLILLAVFLFVVQLAVAVLLALRDLRLGILALFSAAPALLLVGWVWWRDPTRREPLDNLAVTFVLAILFASFAALVNGLFKPLFDVVPYVGMGLFFFVVVGPIEETVKWLSIRVFAYRSDRFDAVIDGAVYGAVAGLGFATIENVLYIVQGSVQQAAGGSNTTQIGVAVGTAVSRALVGPGHVLYSAFAGYYLGLAKFNPDNRGPIVVKGLLIAALIHATYNSMVTYVPQVIQWNLLTFLGSILAFDLVVGYALYRKLSRYADYYERTERAEREDLEGQPDDEDETRAQSDDGSDQSATPASETPAASEESDDA